MPFPRRRVFHLLSLVLVATTTGLASLRADIQNPPGRDRRGISPRGGRNEPVVTAATRPASAGTITGVEVPLGGSVDIVLRATGQFGKSIDFLLRESPAHGSLGEVRPTGRDSALVTYTHREEDGPATDSFSYAVQAAGTAVSAPATVEVRVLDDPPRPAIVASETGDGGTPDLDFGDVPAGVGVARRELWLENRGGGVAVGTLVPPAPWVVEGASAYRLGREERQGFTLVFKPPAARSYTGWVVVGRGAGGSAQLSGAGLRPDHTRPPPAGTAEESAAVPAVAAVAVALFPPSAGPAAPAAPGSSSLVNSSTPPAAPTPVAGDTVASPSTSLPPAGGGGTAYAPLLPASQREEAPVKRLVVAERGKHTLAVTWPAPKPVPAGYRVERRRLWIENDQLQAEWNPYENVAFTAEPNGTVRALLRGLDANEPQTVRVVAVDGRGALSAPSAQVISATLPDPHWWERITPLNALFAGLGVCLLLLWRRKHLHG